MPNASGVAVENGYKEFVCSVFESLTDRVLYKIFFSVTKEK